MPLVPDDVARSLRRLRDADPRGGAVFGASSHGYELHPCLAASIVEAFEVRHRIALPADYRDFLLRIGNGGAGPHYGLVRLGEMDDGHEDAPWEAGGLVGDLARPFPHTQAWNLPPDEIASLNAHEDDDAILEKYWVPVDGALPLAHEGCARRNWLVVTGPEAGRVWRDLTADMDGWTPLTTASGEHATFTDWYGRWLNESVAKALR